MYQCSTFCQKFVAFLSSSACDHYFLVCSSPLSCLCCLYRFTISLSRSPPLSITLLSVSVSLSLPFLLPYSLSASALSLSLCLPPPPSVFVSVSVSVCLCLPLCLPLLLPFCLSASALCLYLCLSVSLCMSLSVSLSVSLCFSVSVSLSVSLLKSQFVASFSNSTSSVHLYSDVVYTYRSIFSHIHLNGQCFWRVSGTRACRWYPQYPHFKNMGRNSSFVSFTHKLQLHVVKSSCAWKSREKNSWSHVWIDLWAGKLILWRNHSQQQDGRHYASFRLLTG